MKRKNKKNDPFELFLFEAAYLKPICSVAYSSYLDAEADIKRHTRFAFISYFIALVFVVVAIFSPSFLVTTALWVCIGSAEFLNARIDRLWSIRFSDQILDMLSEEDFKKIRKELEKYKEEK